MTTPPGTPEEPAKPPRPSVRVEPLRDPVPDARPRAVVVSAALWSTCLALIAVTAAILGVGYRELRARLTDGLAAAAPDTSSTAIDETVTVTLIAGAAAAAVIVLVVASGMLQVLRRRTAGRASLATMSVLATAGSVAFLIATADALPTLARWLLPAVVALAAVSSVPLFLRSVNRWLSSAPARR